MTRLKWRLAVLSALAIYVSTVAGPIGATEGTSDLAACSVAGPIEASALPAKVSPSECNLEGRVITDYGLGAVVPPSGNGVYVESKTPTGALEFEIRTDPDGTVHLLNVGDELAAPSGSLPHPPSLLGVVDEASHPGGGSSPPACDDPAHLEFAKQSQTHVWYYNPIFQPGPFSGDEGESAMKAGFRNITTVNNDCGLTDRVDATSSYAGRTSRRANISTSGNCTSRDSNNVVDWNTQPSTRLATTCAWYIYIFILPPGDPESYEIVEADVVFNNFSFTWTVNPSVGCSSSYDVESAMTHEAGHSFGLSHPGAETEHGHLTMSPNSDGTCQSAERTLGKGDVLGLENCYYIFG